MRKLYKITPKVAFITFCCLLLSYNLSAETLTSPQKDNFIPKRTINDNVKYAEHLKKYNIIIATLASFDGVNRLKSKFDAEGQYNLIVRNKDGLYYFVFGSYDNEDEAIAAAQGVLNKYTRYYDRNELMRKYGIPFTDVWILEVVETK